ncbi:MAG: hypothetical protein A2075_11545 [Geobacteraceae bacterium GWC2_58_44]|nr:MAG: hypothetical protein A2075_11545 [Geobacteraceae bacterium GWC2_58_44]HBG04816.1 hypothetical protein [Geobacter sp.]
MTLRDTFYYLAGIGFLFLAKAKNVMKGYSSPKPFDIFETARCIEYDLSVAQSWLSQLREYTQADDTLAGKKVLELGPGSDLGIGIYLLSKGCAQYHACDVNDLMKSTPDSFYERFFEKLQAMHDQPDLDLLKREVKEAKAGKPSRLNYVVRDDFDLVSAFGATSVDLVFSQAAFEHFDDVAATISQLSAVCKPGATLVAEIDLKTHSRWIRDRDPNNIYRYPSCLYNAFWFRGIPNRVRPFQYREALERFGWTDVSIIPRKKLSANRGDCSGMNQAFAEKKNQMDYLSIMICAKKAEMGS